MHHLTPDYFSPAARHRKRENRRTWVIRITHAVGIVLALAIMATALSIPVAQ